jgi:hypothetical protein
MTLLLTTQTNPGDAQWGDGEGIASAESAWKRPVRVVSSTNVTLSPAPGTIDGVPLSSGNRVGLVGQTDTAENGLYEYDGTDLVRPDDYDGTALVEAGVKVYAQEGGTNAKKTFRLFSPTTPITVDTTGTSWEEDGGGGGGGGEDLAATLAVGNTTGGTNIEVTVGDEIQGVDGSGGSAGGSLVLRPGNGDGAGADGSINSGDAPSSVAGDPRGENAVDFQRVRFAADQVGSGDRSFTMGKYNRNAGADTMVVGSYNRVEGGAGPMTTFGAFNYIQTAQYAWLFGGAYSYGYGATQGGNGGTIMWGGGHTFYDTNELSGMLVAGTSHYWAPAHTAKYNLVGGFNQHFYNATTSSYSAIWGQSVWLYGDIYQSALFISGSYVHSAVNALAVGENHYVDAIGPCVVLGKEGWITNQGEMIFSGSNGGWGSTQAGRVSMAARTTDATTTEFSTADTDTLSADFDRYTLRDDSAISFTAIVSARQTGGTSGTAGDSASWTVNAVIKNIGGTTSMVGGSGGATIAPDFSDAAAAGWRLDVVAGGANGALVLRATGEANKDITWEAHILHAEAGDGRF